MIPEWTSSVAVQAPSEPASASPLVYEVFVAVPFAAVLSVAASEVGLERLGLVLPVAEPLVVRFVVANRLSRSEG